MDRNEVLQNAISAEDQAESKRKRLKRFYVVLGVIFGIEIAVYFFLASLPVRPGGHHLHPELDMVRLLLVFCLAYLGILVHELGHLLAGLLVGLRFFVFMVAPIKVARHKDRIRVTWHRKLNFSGGFAACLPTDTR